MPTSDILRSAGSRRPVGWFDLNYRIAGDYDFMLRALEIHPFRSLLIDRVLVDMLAGGSSTSGWLAYIMHNLDISTDRGGSGSG